MDRSILRNDILTKGAILGGVMLTSRVIETSMISYGGNIGWMLFLLLEWIVMAVVYVILINSFTRGYARKQLASQQGFQHFSYGNGLSYAILISMLAGVIVAIGGYIFLHGIVGYDNYIDANINLVVGVFKDAKMEVPQNVQEMIKEMKAIPEPSIINTLISSVWSYLLSGAIIGSIVAIFTRRKFQPTIKND